ncbi:MAG: transglycosylase family protein [Chloroflexi bacterium]|nr:transglycosylase family protein [Chloroflexota bacterium]
MPDASGRLRAVFTATVTGILLVALVVPPLTEAADPPNIDRFMAALGAVESNGRYDAVNSTSGALGKYQIMPENWASWARRYLGDPNAAPTPANQDLVTRRKLTALYNWLGDWPSVAHWWLTGDGNTDPGAWSDFSRGYVDTVLAVMGSDSLPVLPSVVTAQLTAPQPASGDSTIYDESNREIHFSGGWGQAEYSTYNNGVVRYAIDEGATAWFTFQGTSITWIGPKGPTRGQAKVYLDEELVATVDVYSLHFRPRTPIFSQTFDRLNTHTITIEVVGTPGRETIALDEFVVGG